MTPLYLTETRSVMLSIGATLTVAPAVGGVARVIRVPLPQGSEEPSFADYSLTTSKTYGPFDTEAMFKVINAFGDVGYQVDVPSAGPTNAYARRYSKTLGVGQQTTVYVPAGSGLRLTSASGFVVRGGVVTPISGGELIISPAPELRIYRVVAMGDPVAIETAWYSRPVGWLGLNGLVLGLDRAVLGLRV